MYKFRNEDSKWEDTTCAIWRGKESGQDWDLKLRKGCQLAAVGGKEIGAIREKFCAFALER